MRPLCNGGGGWGREKAKAGEMANVRISVYLVTLSP